MLKQGNDFKDLLLRLLLINAVFVVALTAVSFLFFIFYNFELWKTVAKSDILKVFFMNFRFNLSAAAYMSFPVCAVLMIFPVINAKSVSKYFAVFLRLYYIAVFVILFMFNLYALVSGYFVSAEKLGSYDYLSHFASAFTMFNSKATLTLLAALIFITVCSVIFFSLFVTLFLAAKNYGITDRKKPLIRLICALIFCAVFARGKIFGNLWMEDASVTSNARINCYAVGGAHKLLADIRNFDPKNIKYFELGGVMTQGTMPGQMAASCGMQEATPDMLKTAKEDASKTLRQLNEIDKQASGQ